MHRLERLDTSPVPKFVAGLDLNPSLSNEMAVAPHHSTISLEAKQANPQVSTAPVVPRRSERLVNKPKVDYRQVALQPRWPISTAASSNPCSVSTLYSSSSFAALQQHANSSPFETVPVWCENLSGVVSCPENSNINTDGLDSAVIGSRDQ